MKLAITGVTGNMGQATLEELVKIEEIEKIRLLCHNKKRMKKLLKKYKKFKGKFELVEGSLLNKEVCDRLVSDVDYVVGLAAVIPPLSDQRPELAVECNEIGIKTLVKAIEDVTENQPKFIHTSTVALYGNRNSLHPWAQVGDPLLVSPFDIYSATKLRGEFCVLESEIKNWAVLRQSAMLHNNMLSDNMSDGLMFHTALNSPLEWVTARDSGYLIKNIFLRDSANEISDFWHKIYNIGGGYNGRCTGYDTMNDGFGIIGGNIEKFFKPYHFSARNFHGIWMSDGDKLNELFGYQRDGGHKQFWLDVAKDHPIFVLGKIVPKFLLNLFLFNRLINDENSPTTWVKNKDLPKVKAYFNGMDAAKSISGNWKDIKLLCKNDFGDFDKLRAATSENLLSHGYDESKKLCELTLEDLQKAAEFRGGKCLADKKPENEYIKIKWQCSEGHVFESSIYTVLGGGHWCPACTMPENPICWRFDILAKKSPFIAQLWYDSHDKDEDCLYFIDEQGNQQIKKDTI